MNLFQIAQSTKLARDVANLRVTNATQSLLLAADAYAQSVQTFVDTPANDPNLATLNQFMESKLIGLQMAALHRHGAIAELNDAEGRARDACAAYCTHFPEAVGIV